MPGSDTVTMWDYNDKVKEHFLNPRNIGELPDANAIGHTGSLRCGDAMTLYMKVETIDGEERITDASFQTFGCASAIATASMLTEMIKGKTLAEAETLTNQDIVDALGGLPAPKIHCSVMGAEALEAAIANYRGEEPPGHDEEDRIICACFEISEKTIRDAVWENNLTTVEQVTNHTKAGGACGQCKPDIARIIGEVLEEKAQALCDIEPESERDRKIGRLLAEEIAPQLTGHGGGLQLVAIDGDRVVVRLKGACQMCSNNQGTINDFVQQKLRDEIDESITVEVGG